MPDIVLQRTGKAALQFDGELLFSESSPSFRRHLDNTNAKCQWFVADLYRSKTGVFVLHMAYRFAGPLYRERNWDHVSIEPTRESAIEELKHMDPMKFVAGYPNGREFDRKRGDLNHKIREDYGALVSAFQRRCAELSAPEILA